MIPLPQQIVQRVGRLSALRKDTMRFAGTILSCLLIIGWTNAVCAADIPPPQRFEASPVKTGESARVVVIWASNAIERGEQEHPAGSVFAKNIYCYIKLDIESGPGANATLNVSGSSDPQEIFGSGKEWVSEIPPVEIRNASSVKASSQIRVPLHRKFVEFFLSTPDRPGEPDINTSVGGSILVYATASQCSDTIR
jgi:hypothetical protein